MPQFVDFSGRRFGRWAVVRRAEDYRRGIPQWLCRCSCGNEGVVRAGILKSGQSRSCGCLNLEIRSRICVERNTTHGMSGSRTHRIWCNIFTRCENKKALSYAKYGAKGVSICAQWRTFENFLTDMGKCPSPRHTIDRVNPKGNYEPGNCRWATMKQQQNNRSNNRKITFNGRTMTLQQWADKTGIDRKTISGRIDRLNWPIDQALTASTSPRPRTARNLP